jgi:hypothetical protein
VELVGKGDLRIKCAECSQRRRKRSGEGKREQEGRRGDVE